ncbi:MAG: acetyltransferase-like isoleucine patch superfamily enzyme [Saprospiraceae bacterium]|jgi:acetyltransferase-like isoleucine patch superfamily enzyme
MIRNLILKILKKKNPDFTLDPAVSSVVLLSLSWQKIWCVIRSLKLLFFGKIPNWLFLGRGVRFFNIANMRFGKFVQLEDHVYLNALGKSALELGNNVKIGAYSRLVISTSFNNIGNYIKIGDNVGLGEFAYLGGAGGLEIGADCIIGQYLSCHPENHHFEDTNKLIRLQGTSRKGIKIGKNCWIGAKVTVLDGVIIGDNCVIAAGAVVNKSIPSNTVIGGVPARVIKLIQPLEKEIVYG